MKERGGGRGEEEGRRERRRRRREGGGKGRKRRRRRKEEGRERRKKEKDKEEEEEGSNRRRRMINADKGTPGPRALPSWKTDLNFPRTNQSDSKLACQPFATGFQNGSVFPICKMGTGRPVFPTSSVRVVLGCFDLQSIKYSCTKQLLNETATALWSFLSASFLLSRSAKVIRLIFHHHRVCEWSLNEAVSKGGWPESSLNGDVPFCDCLTSEASAESQIHLTTVPEFMLLCEKLSSAHFTAFLATVKAVKREPGGPCNRHKYEPSIRMEMTVNNGHITPFFRRPYNFELDELLLNRGLPVITGIPLATVARKVIKDSLEQPSRLATEIVVGRGRGVAVIERWKFCLQNWPAAQAGLLPLANISILLLLIASRLPSPLFSGGGRTHLQKALKSFLLEKARGVSGFSFFLCVFHRIEESGKGSSQAGNPIYIPFLLPPACPKCSGFFFLSSFRLWHIDCFGTPGKRSSHWGENAGGGRRRWGRRGGS
ncbi:hypothetical protein L345_06253, partial [Ophiophagus hannah]